MIIEDVDVEVFRYRSKVIQDSEGHTHPGEEHDAIRARTPPSPPTILSINYFALRACA